MFKKALACVLALIMLSSVFVSCDENNALTPFIPSKNNPAETTEAQTTGNDTIPESTESEETSTDRYETVDTDFPEDITPPDNNQNSGNGSNEDNTEDMGANTPQNPNTNRLCFVSLKDICKT